MQRVDRWRPRDATYYACEVTESGRECVRALAGLERGLRLGLHPDFGASPQGHKEVIVYSVHSIEPIRNVPMELITRLYGLADSVKAAHFGPIGWPMVAATQETELTRRHEAQCREKLYNRNFWALLRQAEAEHRIQVRTAIPKLFGLEHNPTSYIVWEETVAWRDLTGRASDRGLQCGHDAVASPSQARASISPPRRRRRPLERLHAPALARRQTDAGSADKDCTASRGS